MRKSNPRIIKYKSDECITKGDYMQAVWEGLKESGVLFRKCKYKNKYKNKYKEGIDNGPFKVYNE